MKNLALYLIVILGISLTSCTKEEFIPLEEEVEQETQIDEEISLSGKWLLRSGKMYMENIETHEKVVYDHFDANKRASSLRFSGSLYEFEDIYVDSTTWSFHLPASVPGYGEFILDDDTIQPYGLNITASNWTVIEHPTVTSAAGMQLGGSARPIRAFIEDYGSNTVVFYVQEAYESIDGWNYKYFSELTFEKIEEW